MLIFKYPNKKCWLTLIFNYHFILFSCAKMGHAVKCHKHQTINGGYYCINGGKKSGQGEMRTIK